MIFLYCAFRVFLTLLEFWALWGWVGSCSRSDMVIPSLYPRSDTLSLRSITVPLVQGRLGAQRPGRVMSLIRQETTNQNTHLTIIFVQRISTARLCLFKGKVRLVRFSVPLDIRMSLTLNKNLDLSCACSDPGQASHKSSPQLLINAPRPGISRDAMPVQSTRQQRLRLVEGLGIQSAVKSSNGPCESPLSRGSLFGRLLFRLNGDVVQV